VRLRRGLTAADPEPGQPIPTVPEPGGLALRLRTAAEPEPLRPSRLIIVLARRVAPFAAVVAVAAPAIVLRLWNLQYGGFQQ